MPLSNGQAAITLNRRAPPQSRADISLPSFDTLLLYACLTSIIAALLVIIRGCFFVYAWHDTICVTLGFTALAAVAWLLYVTFYVDDSMLVLCYYGLVVYLLTVVSALVDLRLHNDGEGGIELV